MQGSIQQLVLKSDPTAPDDQCEEDDPYVRHFTTLHASDVILDMAPKLPLADLNLHIMRKPPEESQPQCLNCRSL